jgi:hypothetical protein
MSAGVAAVPHTAPRLMRPGFLRAAKGVFMNLEDFGEV